MDTATLYTGYVIDKQNQNKKTDVIFTVEGFRIIFIDSGFSKSHSQLKPDHDGYIWGRLSNGNLISIYAGASVVEFGFSDVASLKTWNYIVVSHVKNKIEFDGIKFKNGSIKSIYPCNAMHRDFALEEKIKGDVTENNKAIVYRLKPDEMEFSCSVDNLKTRWLFRSDVTSTSNKN